MEIIEKLPDQLVNIVYSFVGKHPVAELYDDEVDEIVDSDDDENLSPKQIAYRILADKRKRLRRSTPSNKIAELYRQERWRIRHYACSYLYPDEIPSCILANKRKRLRRSAPSYKICLLVSEAITAYNKYRYKHIKGNLPVKSFAQWAFEYPIYYYDGKINGPDYLSQFLMQKMMHNF